MATLDLTKYKTPAAAAKALHKWACERALEMGQRPEIEVGIWSPEESLEQGYPKAWRVSWEAGPYEWAVYASLGGDWKNGYSNHEPTLKMTGSRDWLAEPYYSFDICFTKA